MARGRGLAGQRFAAWLRQSREVTRGRLRVPGVTTCDQQRMKARGRHSCRYIDTLIRRCAGKPGRRTCPAALGALMHLFRFRHHRRSRPQPPPGHEVVRLHGDLGLRNADATGRRLVQVIDRGPDVLEVDLTDVKNLSPDGCGAFFTALRAARARGVRLVITHANERAQAVLWQMGLTRALTDGGAGAR
ncbi:STAS domain-containing protein [Streptomyces sp. NPDC051738]|uniref:STAS domain-containing protein n=1 Tax=Streptomyces sp. NPDC051738 TaxID=3365672 RepID=UPI0037D7C80C